MFFPAEDFEEVEYHPSHVEHEILKGIIGLCDVIGLYILFDSKKMISFIGEADIKIMAIGLGWAAAELFTNNFVNIILQGWANEMKVEYLIAAISTNFDILEILALATFAWILTQRK